MPRAHAFSEKVTIAHVPVAERLAWLQLYRSENVGVKAFYTLMSLCGTAEEALLQATELSLRGGRTRPIKISSKTDAARELEALEKFGAQMLIRLDPEYPELLSNIDDPPPVLTVRGNVELLSKPTIAMVGARNASANGCRFAHQLAAELGKEKFVVASGLARGIDTSAHQGALNSGTVAVIAGGIDNIYPPENAKLFAAIAEQGAIIAELPYGSSPLPRHFPQRNRIISGLSQGTVVVEATLRSGSLITAKLTLEQGREVFAVPGSPLDPRAEGPNHLIKQGATLISSVRDIIEALPNQGNAFRETLAEKRGDDFTSVRFIPPSKEELEEARRTIVSLLSTTPIAVDHLIRHSECVAPVVQIVLLELELAGRLERHPGNRVSLLLSAK